MHPNNNTKQSSKHQPFYQDILFPDKKHECASCKKDTSQHTYILTSNGIIYCVTCFAKLKKWPSYYHVINKLQFPVLDQQWTALEEIYMFQGLQKHGLGNWGQISEYIQTSKTKQEIEKHYVQFFMNGPSFMPQQSKLLSRRSSSTSKQKQKNVKNRQTVTSKRLQSLNQQKTLPKKSSIQIIGYMPLRNDYQYQYDNEAQLWLGQMQFNQDDTPQQKQMKFKIIQIYNRKLTERNKKKEFVNSRGILDLEKQIQIEKTVPKTEKQIYNMMKIFSRFHTASDHEQLVKGIIKQKQLRQKIEEYKQLHRRGYRTKAEVEQQIQRKNQTSKPKKKLTNQYTFPVSSFDQPRNNRRTNHHTNTLDAILKKPSVYLTPAQVQLLKTNKLSTITYMMIKQTILRENAKIGYIDRETVIPIFNLEKYVVNNVIDYLVGSQEIVCMQ